MKINTIPKFIFISLFCLFPLNIMGSNDQRFIPPQNRIAPDGVQQTPEESCAVLSGCCGCLIGVGTLSSAIFCTASESCGESAEISLWTVFGISMLCCLVCCYKGAKRSYQEQYRRLVF